MPDGAPGVTACGSFFRCYISFRLCVRVCVRVSVCVFVYVCMCVYLCGLDVCFCCLVFHTVSIPSESNKGTGGMESSVVLFKPCIHLFACTHPSVSNRWFVMTGWRTSISRQPVFKHLWIVVPDCIQASVSSTVFQTIMDYGSVSGYKHLPPASLVKHVWILVPCCVQAAVSTRVPNTF